MEEEDLDFDFVDSVLKDFRMAFPENRRDRTRSEERKERDRILEEKKREEEAAEREKKAVARR